MNVEWVNLDPELGDRGGAYLHFCGRIAEAFRCTDRHKLLESTRELREEILSRNRGPIATDDLRLLLAESIALDLVSHGWDFRVGKDGVQVRVRKGGQLQVAEEKEIVRKSHFIERDEQLREPSVSQFIKNMEKRRLYAKGWHSIFSLMRNGRELAEKLAEIKETSEPEQRERRLASVISPYIQFAESNETCQFTGVKLSDIWRYFRHTWVNAYRTLPGRSIAMLIRDAAAPNHPVIGIAAIGSSVVQQRERDIWLGWDSDEFLAELDKEPNSKRAGWLLGTLQDLIDDIYFADIRKKGWYSSLEVKYPDDSVVKRLQDESLKAMDTHRKYPHKSHHKSQKIGNGGEIDWKSQAESKLFLSKRCKKLATLLKIRKTFQDVGFTERKKKSLMAALEFSKTRSAIGQLVRFKKAEHMGIDMMDITVCGAVAPYNHLLGGKLVCMLLCSPEVGKYYAKKYSEQTSIIASSMKGSAVVRKPNLVVFGTTSLYGVGSSQYNRVRIPLSEVGGNHAEMVDYKEIGLSEGFGSYHLSKETGNLTKLLLARSKQGRRVNFIFGEGVNPKLRHLREALNEIGLPSDILLRHGNRRIVYGVKLAANAKEILLGINKRPRYLIPQTNPRQKTEAIASYWRERWLSRRINRPEILQAVSSHTLSYPITHGARVLLPEEGDDLDLFGRPD